MVHVSSGTEEWTALTSVYHCNNYNNDITYNYNYNNDIINYNITYNYNYNNDIMNYNYNMLLLLVVV